MNAPAALALIGLVASASAAGAYCPCVANGKLFEQGAVACLTLPAGEYLARCDAVLNNSSWTRIAETCADAPSGDPAGSLFTFGEEELRAWDEGTARGQCQAAEGSETADPH